MRTFRRTRTSARRTAIRGSLSILVCMLSVGGFLGVAVLDARPAFGDALTWSATSTPNGGSLTNQLNAVSCTSASFCKAVGTFQNATDTPQAMAESWNGNRWSLDSSATLSSPSFLTGVSCTSAAFCMAVGRPNTEQWDGTSWSVVSSPIPDSGTVSAVSCTSPTMCMAAGSYYDTENDLPQTLVATWNGVSWSVSPSPNEGTGYNVLDGVSCSNSSFCIADGTAGALALIESWNGSTWSIDSSPEPGTDYDYLDGVTCSSTTFCMAVGNDFTGNQDSTLAESWNGTSWSVSPSLSPGYGEELLGASCTAPTNCVSVGYYDYGENLSFIEHWNGTDWEFENQSIPINTGSSLSGVSCAGLDSCLAAGDYDNYISGEMETLAEMSSALPAPEISSISPKSGISGSVVTIAGTNLTAPGQESEVSFNGVSAPIRKISAREIKAIVPAGASSGPIEVTTVAGSAFSHKFFDVLPTPAPTIKAFTPGSGPVGTNVTISGTYLAFATAITFNGTAAQISSDSERRIVAIVPAGATTGMIAVTTAGGTVTSATNFKVK